MDKSCPRCEERKPLSEFNKCSASNDGRAGWCRECYRAYSKARRPVIQQRHNERYRNDSEFRERRRKANRERMLSKYQNDADYRERYNARRKDADYREVSNRRRRERYATDTDYRDNILERGRLYCQTPDGKAARAARSARYYAKHNGRAYRNKWTADDIIKRYAYQAGRCLGCYTAMPLTELECDHNLPWTRGGQETFDNLLLLCRSCNARKGQKTFAEWLVR